MKPFIAYELTYQGKVARKFVKVGHINDYDYCMLYTEQQPYHRLFVDIGEKDMYFVCYADRVEILKKFTHDMIVDNAKAHIRKASETCDAKINLGVAERFGCYEQAVKHNQKVEAYNKAEDEKRYKAYLKEKENEEQLRKEEYEKSVDNAIELYRQGRAISGVIFLDVCKRYGIKPAPKTIRAIKKYVKYINVERIVYVGCEEKSLMGTYKLKQNLDKVIKH